MSATPSKRRDARLCRPQYRFAAHFQLFTNTFLIPSPWVYFPGTDRVTLLIPSPWVYFPGLTVSRYLFQASDIISPGLTVTRYLFQALDITSPGLTVSRYLFQAPDITSPGLTVTRVLFQALKLLPQDWPWHVSYSKPSEYFLRTDRDTCLISSPSDTSPGLTVTLTRLIHFIVLSKLYFDSLTGS